MPDFDEENKYNGLVAGIDEAGRGPWAGPVVAAAAVVLDKNLPAEALFRPVIAVDKLKK